MFIEIGPGKDLEAFDWQGDGDLIRLPISYQVALCEVSFEENGLEIDFFDLEQEPDKSLVIKALNQFNLSLGSFGEAVEEIQAWSKFWAQCEYQTKTLIYGFVKYGLKQENELVKFARKHSEKFQLYQECGCLDVLECFDDIVSFPWLAYPFNEDGTLGQVCKQILKWREPFDGEPGYIPS